MRKLTLKSGKEYHLNDLPGADKLIYDTDGFPSTSNFTKISSGATIKHLDRTMKLITKRNRLVWQDQDHPDQIGGYLDQYGMENGMPPVGMPVSSLAGYGAGGYYQNNSGYYPPTGGYYPPTGGYTMGGYPGTLPIIPGSGITPMIMPNTLALGGLQTPLSQSGFTRRSLNMFLRYIRGLAMKGINWKQLNVKELQDLINISSSIKNVSMTLTAILNQFKNDLDENVMTRAIDIYNEIKDKGYGEKYNNVLANEKETINNFVKVFQPFSAMCSPLTMSTGTVTTEAQMLYSRQLCEIYTRMVKLNKDIGLLSMRNDFKYVLDEIEKIAINQETIQQYQTQLTQLLSDASTIYSQVGGSGVLGGDLIARYNKIHAKFPTGSLSSIDLAGAMGTTPTNVGPLTKGPRQQFTQQQQQEALKYAQAQQTAEPPAAPIDPFTQQQKQSVVQVGAGKLPIGSFFNDEESLDQNNLPQSVMIPRSTRQNSASNDDLISTYINIAKNAIKDKLESMYQSSEASAEEVIIRRD
jgi:hypothetical protein